MWILAADDDPAVRKSLQRLLERWGYDVRLAADGLEAWQILKSDDAPSIMILDWDMPGMKGIEVCRMLRQLPKGRHAYVLVLTGRQHKDDLVTALESGADEFLSKPFDPRELQLRLAKGIRDITKMNTLRGSTLDRPSPSSHARKPPPSGTTLDGKYRLERKLAEGGMGSVWLGVHLALGVNVAVKFMRPDLAETAAYASFEAEARAAAQLRSEHIVRVYDHGLTEAGAPYLVMEYLSGESLDARIGRLGPMSPPEVVAMVEQAARALTEAHAHNVIHRDVKSENVLLEPDEESVHGMRVKLIDFGIAKRVDPREENDRHAIAGTPGFMSPEYLSGRVPPNPQLDLWGLAACAFDAMTGHRPFDGDSFDEVRRTICDEPLPIPSTFHEGVPRGFDAWFARACAHDPVARFASAAELAAALSDALSSPPARSAPRVLHPREPVAFSAAEAESETHPTFGPRS